MKKKLVVVGMLAAIAGVVAVFKSHHSCNGCQHAIAGVVAVFKSRKKYTKVRKNY